jgi:hypothetical protein
MLLTLSGVPAARVEAVLAENRNAAFCALYKKAGLPMSAFGVFAAAVEAWRAALSGDNGIEFDKLPRLVTRTVLANYEPAGDPQVDELLVLLRKIAAETARDNARANAGQIAQEHRRREQLLLATPQSEPEVVSPEERYPVADLPEEVIMNFAVQLAEVIVDLEDPDNRREDGVVTSGPEANSTNGTTGHLPSFESLEPDEPGLPANDLAELEDPEIRDSDSRKNPLQPRYAPSLLAGSTRGAKRSVAA